MALRIPARIRATANNAMMTAHVSIEMRGFDGTEGCAIGLKLLK
jgi:hypothetical protein